MNEKTSGSPFILIDCRMTAEQEDVSIGTYMLQAESAYIAADNDQDATVYIIDTYSNEVYVGVKEKPLQKKTESALKR